MKNFQKLLAVAIMFAVGSTAMFAQGGSKPLKIGFVSSEKILANFSVAIDAQKKIDSIIKSWQDSVDVMGKALQTKVDAYQKKEGTMNEQAKAAEQQKLLDERSRIQDFQQSKFGQRGELAQTTEKIMKPVREEVLKAIQAVAKDEGFSFVFDQTEQNLVLLYGEPRFDLTFKVLDRLRR